MPAVRIVEIGAAAGHAGPEVRADRAEDHDDAAGHVLAAVLAEALDDRVGAGVADGEAHPGPADQVEPATGRAVQAGVAGDRLAARRPRRGPAPGRRPAARPTVPCRRSRWPGRPASGRGPARRTPRTTGPRRRGARDGSGRGAGPARARRTAPPRTSGRRSSGAGRRRRTRPDRRGRRRGCCSSGDAGWRGTSRSAVAGCARRAGDACHDPAPTTAARSSVRAPARRDGASRRRLSPTTSPTDRAPTAASSRRRSSARASAKRSTASGVPVNFARRSSRWVAIPVGHVSRWHWRAMSQPSATSIAVPNANSSAPSRAATSRSRPVRRPPSVRSATRSRRPFRSSVWWTSARPSSHGAPTCLIELSGEAPVPPAWPLRCT